MPRLYPHFLLKITIGWDCLPTLVISISSIIHRLLLLLSSSFVLLLLLLILTCSSLTLSNIYMAIDSPNNNVYTFAHVSQHNHSKDCWLIISGKVWSGLSLYCPSIWRSGSCFSPCLFLNRWFPSFLLPWNHGFMNPKKPLFSFLHWISYQLHIKVELLIFFVGSLFYFDDWLSLCICLGHVNLYAYLYVYVYRYV